MSDLLSQLFDKFLGAECSPEVFERELLAASRSSPECAWEALALLDRYYRQRKISDHLCRALRQQIGAHAMRLEGHAVELLHDPEADSLFAATQAAAAKSSRQPLAMPQASAVPPAVVAPSTAHAQGAPADAAPLADDGVDTLLTTPTVPVSRQAERERPRGQSAGERVPDTHSSSAGGSASPARWRRGFQTSPALG